jgi:hypothetical protein
MAELPRQLPKHDTRPAEAQPVPVPAEGSGEDGAEEAAEEPIYIARKLADAQRLEQVLLGAGIVYEVEPDYYVGGAVFRRTRVGAFFYVAAEVRARAAAIMLEHGFSPLQSGDGGYRHAR